MLTLSVVDVDGFYSEELATQESFSYEDILIFVENFFGDEVALDLVGENTWDVSVNDESYKVVIA